MINITGANYIIIIDVSVCPRLSVTGLLSDGILPVDFSRLMIGTKSTKVECFLTFVSKPLLS